MGSSDGGAMAVLLYPVLDAPGWAVDVIPWDGLEAQRYRAGQRRAMDTA